MGIKGNIIVPDYEFYSDLPDKELLFNPIVDVPLNLREESELAEFYKLSNEHFSPEFGIKYLLNVNLYPFQMSAIRAMFLHKFPMLLFSRGLSKTFTLAVFAIIYAVLFPGSRIVLVAGSFRQSKHIFNEIKRIYNRSPLLKLISRKEPTIAVDRCNYTVNDSYIVALPLSRDKIRGERGHVILVDEFGSIDSETFDVVIRGFGATAADPWEKTKSLMQKKQLSEKDQLLHSLISSGNKIVLSGTAGYKNGSLYRVYKHYMSIIRNNISGYAQDFSDILESDFDENQEINCDDYCITRYTYKEAPPGMMDQRLIEDSRRAMPKLLFNMEYMCFKKDTEIITNTGIKKICNVRTGDLVLTHKGRFRKVTEILKNNYSGQVIDYKTWGYNKNCVVTSNHPYWIDGNNWEEISSIENETKLANLKELNNKKCIDLRDYVSDFTERNNKIFPRTSQTKLSNDQVREIVESNEHKKTLAAKHDVCLATIYQVKNKNSIPKTAIPYNLSLDFDFGLIVGYYAAEGSVGAKGKATCFSLDGHTNNSLEFYVKQLTSAVGKVLGIQPKQYKNGSVVNVTINQRLFAEFIKKVCPGTATNKVINPDLLFSNEEFMKGIIIGYFNGDGHVSSNSATVKASSASIDLISQIRLILSYFGVTTSFNYKPIDDYGFIYDRKVKLNDQYIIEMHGANAAKFRKLFYNQKIKCQPSRKYNNNGESSLFTLREKKELSYSGQVFNLEVEEDHSYSLLTATVHNCKFADDSAGFFKARDIQKATSKYPDGFSVLKKGKPNKQYVIGVDPARTQDRFAICVIELGKPNKIVYMWVCQNEKYSYAAAHLRKIRRLFHNTVAIAMDLGGGGLAVEEILNSTDVIESGDKAIYRADDDEAPNDGEKILHMIHFNFKWIDEANTILQKNIEDQVLMFPIPISSDEDIEKDDIVYEIQELKKELTSIEVTYTKSGKRHFDLMPIVASTIDDIIRHKDRYSALLLANYMISGSIDKNIDPKDTAKKIYNKIAGGWMEDLAR